MSKLRVLVATNQPIFRAGLRAALAEELEVVGVVVDGPSLLDAVAEHAPDLVIVDISSASATPTGAIGELKARYPELAIIGFADDSSASRAEAAFRVGLDGYLLRTSTGAEVSTAIGEVRQGRTYVTPEVAKKVLDLFIGRSHAADSLDRLTVRQREVLQLTAEGHSVKGIAEALNISPKTAESHRYTLMKRLGLRGTAELTRYAVRHGIVSAD
jgi:DNA-binding NarL/FixJ family response regulator